MSLPQFYVDDIILCALKEDINYLDVSADYLIPEDHTKEHDLTAHFSSSQLLQKL